VELDDGLYNIRLHSGYECGISIVYISWTLLILHIRAKGRFRAPPNGDILLSAINPKRQLMEPYMLHHLSTPLAEFLSPILELLETLLANTRTDVDETCLEVFELDRADLVH
jgi:hypothetical protein